MSNFASEKMLQAVAVAKESACKAEAEFDRRNSDIQRKASNSIDLFGGDARRRVVEIASDSRRACDELYATYQALIPMLDNLCRPILEEQPSADAVNAVQKMIKWLNDESEIENNYSASLNSHDLGGILTAKYIPSMENKIIQKFWEQTFTAMPEAKEILRKEKEEQQRKEKAKEDARKHIAEMKRQSREITTLSIEDPQEVEAHNTEQQTQMEALIAGIEISIRSSTNTIKKEEKSYLASNEEIDAKIDQLSQERKAAGLFAKKRKEELEEQINGLVTKKAAVHEAHQKRAIELEAEKLALKEQRDKVISCRPLVNPKVGDIFPFGTDPLSKGKSPIYWIVVQVSTSQVALLSRDILGYGAFKSESMYSKHDSYVDWLKKFENNAFSVDEKKALIKSPIDYQGCPKYAFVFTKMDAKNFLQNYLPAEPTEELLNDFQSNPKFSAYEKRSFTNSVSSSYWLHSRDVWSELTVNRIKRNEKGKWEVLTQGKVTNDEFTIGIRPAILVDRNLLARQALTQNTAPSKQRIDYYKEQLEQNYAQKMEQKRTEKENENKKAAKRSSLIMFFSMLVTGIGLHLVLSAIAYMQSLILPLFVLAAGIGLWTFYFIKRGSCKDSSKHNFLKICAVILLVVILWDIVLAIQYTPLRNSIGNNTISSSYNLSSDTGALKIIASQLEKYHQENDLDSVLALYTVAAQRGARFEQAGNYLISWYSFANWIFAEAREHGTPTESRDYPYIDSAYEYHGYKIAFYESDVNSDCVGIELFVPNYPYNDGWCGIDFSYKDFGNMTYHAQNGGIMYD